jgi:hypothetical protein
MNGFGSAKAVILQKSQPSESPLTCDDDDDDDDDDRDAAVRHPFLVVDLVRDATRRLVLAPTTMSSRCI